MNSTQRAFRSFILLSHSSQCSLSFFLVSSPLSSVVSPSNLSSSDPFIRHEFNYFDCLKKHKKQKKSILNIVVLFRACVCIYTKVGFIYVLWFDCGICLILLININCRKENCCCWDKEFSIYFQSIIFCA